MLCRGWGLPGYPGLQWGEVSMHKLLRRWKRQRPDVLYIATEGPLGLSALRAARRLGIAVVSGFHTNFQQYTGHYGIGLLTRAMTYIGQSTLILLIFHGEIQHKTFDLMERLGLPALPAACVGFVVAVVVPLLIGEVIKRVAFLRFFYFPFPLRKAAK